MAAIPAHEPMMYAQVEAEAIMRKHETNRSVLLMGTKSPARGQRPGITQRAVNWEAVQE